MINIGWVEEDLRIPQAWFLEYEVFSYTESIPTQLMHLLNSTKQPLPSISLLVTLSPRSFTYHPRAYITSYHKLGALTRPRSHTPRVYTTPLAKLPAKISRSSMINKVNENSKLHVEFFGILHTIRYSPGVSLLYTQSYFQHLQIQLPPILQECLPNC